MIVDILDREDCRQFNVHRREDPPMPFSETCRQSSRSNLSGIYPVCTLSLWTSPLTRFASLRQGSARKSTSPRTRGEVEQAARALPHPSSEPYAIALRVQGEVGFQAKRRNLGEGAWLRI